MEKDDQKLQLKTVSASGCIAVTAAGPVEMLGITFSAHQEGQAQPVVFPTLWMTTDAARALAQSIGIALAREFPNSPHRAEEPPSTPPGQSTH